MNHQELSGALEAILFAAGEPLAEDKIAQALDLSLPAIHTAIDSLKKKYNLSSSGIHIVLVENKVQMTTNPAYIEPVRETLALKRNAPLSQAALEVLAVVAYNQPVTKAFVEQVRGVDCSGVVGSLMQKGLLEERGRLELPGRPLLYGTTDHFLMSLGISSLEDLPAPTNSAKVKSDDADQLAF
ncbi:SMC-Scp complex subunit ScpB [Scatolibacter rhodanostii]|uniref:SMC-Scp complex subunit ScpB n=1 Tax=Scatolibacter rhodanostii TaxID=2014781 RepID=UPI000C073436|nr:SMC-Scp complex subunit ScpB [Scatolibacter rhodanostii]